MTSDELVAAVRQAINDTERVARDASNGPWVNEVGDVREADGGNWVANAGVADRRHVAIHDPASVLRRVEADRRVLDRHSRSDFGRWCGTCDWCSDTNGDALERWPCPDLLDLADRYGIEIEETERG